MKILCLCQKGNSRSVALAWYLKSVHKHEALAAGFVTTSRNTRRLLCHWADLVIVTDQKYAHWVHDEFKPKLKIWHVGTDKWFRGFDSDLVGLFEGFYEKDMGGLLCQ